MARAKEKPETRKKQVSSVICMKKQAFSTYLEGNSDEKTLRLISQLFATPSIQSSPTSVTKLRDNEMKPEDVA